MEQYNVTGMSCAACSARVEKAVKKVPGVTSCSVSLLTNSMGVEGTASSAAIIQAVQEAGYGASPKAAGAAAASSPSADLDALADHETPKLKRRLIASLGFLLVLMYFSMGHMMWGWPLPHWFDGNHVAMGLVQLLLAGIVMVINQKFFINGFKGLIHGSPNMDTLVAMGSMASFVWSTYALFAMTRAQVDGNDELVMHYMMEFYFESAAMILTLITVGKMLEAPEVTDFAALPGNGLSAKLDGKEIFGGNAAFTGTKVTVPAELAQAAAELSAQGKTPLFFGGAGRLLGVIAVADTIKEDSPRAIRELQAMGIKVVMLTGDNQRTADAIGKQAGVDAVIAGVLPDGKEAVIRQLQAAGKVAMVGDGINDAPALTRADTGIAIGAGTDVAIDAADVVLMNSRLSDVPAAIRLSRATLRNIHENLFWAFLYNTIGIPLAAGAFIPFGLTLNPMFGAAAMSLSSFCVVSNALRLNLFDLHSTKHDHPLKNASALPAALTQPAAVEDKERTIKEDTTMKKTLHVEGMMCGHCEARVKKALEALPEVTEAVVSHEAGTAVVTLSAEVSDDVLKKTVEDQDYKVTGIQ